MSSQAGLRACRFNLLAGLPGPIVQCPFGVRTCLPLRGSSGFSPDSLFILKRRNRGMWTTLYWIGGERNTICCGYLVRSGPGQVEDSD